MRAFWVFVLLLCLADGALAADGEVYGGALFNSTRRASPGGGAAKYIAGVEIGHKVFDALRPYAKVETLMDWRDGGTFHPSSVEYEAGLEWFVGTGVSLKASHSCWHPVDSGGSVEQWDLIQIRYQFGK
jgi:hypothetical protein